MQEPILRNENDQVEIGRHIYEVRKERGISQDRLADLTLTSQNKVYLHENGKHDMGASTLCQYADALHVHPLRLLPERYSRVQAEDKMDQLRSVCAQLSGEQIDLLIRMGENMLR